MATRRRRMSRVTSRARGQNGRERLWVQSTLGNISLVEAATGTFSGEMVVPTDWEREALAFTQVPNRAGGPRLEAMYLSVALNLNEDMTFAPASPELLVYSQSSQFANIVDSSTSFTAAFQNQRVLMYDAATMRKDALVRDVIGGVTWQFSASAWHLKSKCRLADTAVNVAVRLSLDVSAFSEASVQVAFRAYLSLP